MNKPDTETTKLSPLACIDLLCLCWQREKPMKTFTENEVKNIVQNIYSEFAELPLNQKTTVSLRHIIEIEVERNPFKPIQIFTTNETSVSQEKA